jgi:hypothetical protein
MVALQKPSGLTKITLSAEKRFGDFNQPGNLNWTIVWKKSKPDAICFQPFLGNSISPITLFPRFRIESKMVQAPGTFYSPVQLTHYFPNCAEINFQLWKGIECTTEIMLDKLDTLVVKFKCSTQLEFPIKISLEWFLLNTTTIARSVVPLKTGKGVFLQSEVGARILQTCFDGGSTFGQESIPSLTQSMLLEPKLINEFILLIGNGKTTSDCQETLNGAKGLDWDAMMAREVIHYSNSMIHIVTQNSDWNELLHYSQVHALRIIKGFGRSDTNSAEAETQTRSLFELKHGLSISGNLLAENFKVLLSDFYCKQKENGQIHWTQPAPTHTVEGMAFPVAMDMALQIVLQTRDINWLQSLYPKLKLGLLAWFLKLNDKDRDGCPEWSHPSQAGMDEAILMDQYPLYFHPYHLNKMENPGLLSLLHDEQLSAAMLADLLDLPQDAAFWRVSAEKSLQQMNQFWQVNKKTFQVLDYEAHHNLPSKTIQKGKGDARLTLQWQQAQAFRIQIIITLQETYTRPLRIKIMGSAQGERREETINYAKLIWQKNQAVGITDSVYDSLEEIQIVGLRADETWVIQTLHYSYQDISMLLSYLHEDFSKKKNHAAQFHTALEQNCQPYGYPLLQAPQKAVQAYCIASIPWNCLLIEKLMDRGELASAVTLFERIMAVASLQLTQESCVSSYYDCQSGVGFGEKNTLQGLIPVALFLRLAGIQKINHDEIIITHFNPFHDRFTVQYRGISLTLLSAKVEVSYRGLMDSITQPGTYRICFPLNVVK